MMTQWFESYIEYICHQRNPAGKRKMADSLESKLQQIARDWTACNHELVVPLNLLSISK